MGDEFVAEPPPFFGRNRTIYDPWHYLPVLVTKPGALRNGAPFQGWELLPALARLRPKLGNRDERDRRFVRVLAAVLSDGPDAVEAAVRDALDAGAASGRFDNRIGRAGNVRALCRIHAAEGIDQSTRSRSIPTILMIM